MLFLQRYEHNSVAKLGNPRMACCALVLSMVLRAVSPPLTELLMVIPLLHR